MATTKLNNGQLPTTLSSKTIDNSNDISTTTTKLKISGGTNGQVLSTDGSGNLSWTTAGGGVSDGDKGDITVSSSGTVWTIDNDAVTYAKMQNVTTNRLLGRVSSGTGNTEEITIGSGLSVSGTTLSALGAPIAVVTKTADETVTSSTTLQNDDHLFYTLSGGKTYWIEFKIMASRTNTTNAQQPLFAIDANSTGYWTNLRNNTATLANGTATGAISQALANANIPLPNTAVGSFILSSNTTLQVKWAQSTNNTTGVTIHKGSQMIIWEVA